MKNAQKTKLGILKNFILSLWIIIASSQSDAQCSFASDPTRKSYMDLAKVIDEGLKPLYFEKYHIKEFLRDAVAKAPHQREALEESLNRNLLDLKPEDMPDPLEIDVKKGTSPEANFSLAISQVFTKVGREIPIIKEIANNYVIKVSVNADVDFHGGQMGQMKTITVASNNKSKNRIQGSLNYSVCDKDSRLMNLGSKAGCAYEKRAAGNFETKVSESLYLGGNFSSSGLNLSNPEGGLFFRVEY